MRLASPPFPMLTECLTQTSPCPAGDAHADRHPRRRPRHPARRGDRSPAQADGRDRRPADPLAHHEHYAAHWVHGVRRRPRLQERSRQAVLPRVRAADRQPVGRPRPRRGHAPRRGGRGLDRPPHRHRADHQHRRAGPAARRRGSQDGTFMLTYGDGRERRGPAGAAPVPPRARASSRP